MLGRKTLARLFGARRSGPARTTSVPFRRKALFEALEPRVLLSADLPGAPPPAGSRATDEKGGATFVRRYLDDDVLARVQRLKPLAEEAGLTLAQLAVAWVLQNDNVAAAIIGASRPEQVTDNVRAAGLRLDDGLMRAVDTTLEGVIQRSPALTRSPDRDSFH